MALGSPTDFSFVTRLLLESKDVPGTSFTTTFSVINTGWANIASLEVGYYLSKDLTFSSDDVMVGSTVITDVTGAGYSNPFEPEPDIFTTSTSDSFTSTIPADLPDGKYYFMQVIDPNNLVAEANEQNNVRYDVFEGPDIFGDTVFQASYLNYSVIEFGARLDGAAIFLNHYVLQPSSAGTAFTGEMLLYDTKVEGSNFGDVITTGAGADTILGGKGNDWLYGGEDNDRIFGQAGQDALDGGAGNDFLVGGGGSDWFRGRDGNDKLFGGNGKDTMEGGAGRDVLRGDRNNDSLNGESGKDVLLGGAGKDMLDGGSGDDKMTGGSGADTFIFSRGDDRITDFNAANNNEKIDFSEVNSVKHFRDLKNHHTTQDGEDLVITAANGSTLTLIGLEVGDLDRGDFIF